MAKTIIRLEESDIDLKENDLHKKLTTLLLIATLQMSAPRKDVDLTNEDDANRVFKKSVVTFLNGLSDSGYVISKTEEIPSAFYNA